MTEVTPCVLLVEDNYEALEIYTRVFQFNGFEVRTALDASTALEVLNEDPIAIALLDYQLPDRNGVELCKQIKSDPATAHIPVIVLTIEATDEVAARSSAAGADGFYAKPPDIEALVARCKELINETN